MRTGFGWEDKGRHSSFNLWINTLVYNQAINNIKTVIYQGNFANNNTFIIILVIPHVKWINDHIKEPKRLSLDAFRQPQVWQMHLASRLCLDPLREVWALPRPTSQNRERGPTSKGKGGKGREKRGMGLPPLYLTSGYGPDFNNAAIESKLTLTEGRTSMN